MTEPPDGADLSRAEATRGRILDAAVQAFADKGFHGTTTRDITSACGLSSAGLYVHHKSKEELLHQISLAGHVTTLQLVIDSKAASTDPVEQLSSTMRAFAADRRSRRGHRGLRHHRPAHGGHGPALARHRRGQVVSRRRRVGSRGDCRVLRGSCPAHGGGLGDRHLTSRNCPTQPELAHPVLHHGTRRGNSVGPWGVRYSRFSKAGGGVHAYTIRPVRAREWRL